MQQDFEAALAKWHEFVRSQGQRLDILDELLAEEVVFHSPVVWTPQAGKLITTRYLVAAAQVLQDFQYHRQFRSDDSVALEFSARIGDTIVKAMDIIRFNAGGKIIDFEVMARPARALQALALAMGERLAGYKA
jgi:hypothetical protein